MADDVYAYVDIPGVGLKKVLVVSEPSDIADYGSLNNCFIELNNGKKALAVLSYLSEIATLKVGDVAGGNYFEIEADGTDVKKGNATVWDDIVNSLVGRRLYSNTGTLDYDYDENAIKMQNDGDITNRNDRIIFDLQYVHAAKANGRMNLHIHWEQKSTDRIEFTVEYRIQKNNNLKTTAWTQVISNSDDNSVFTYPGAGTFNQITELASVDMTGAGMSATVDFRFTRSDSTVDDLLAKFIDAHIEIDMDGSREPYVK